jgi:Protein of unknown function (DUF1469).
MFTKKSTKGFQQIFEECKKYIELQKEFVRLELIEKITIVFSTLLLILVIFILSMMVLFYLLFSLAYLLDPYVGGLTNSFLIISGIVLVLIFLFYFLRKKLIINPILNFIANLFYNDSSK